jgi:hypothetical protein
LISSLFSSALELTSIRPMVHAWRSNNQLDIDASSLRPLSDRAANLETRNGHWKVVGQEVGSLPRVWIWAGLIRVLQGRWFVNDRRRRTHGFVWYIRGIQEQGQSMRSRWGWYFVNDRWDFNLPLTIRTCTCSSSARVSGGSSMPLVRLIVPKTEF